MALVRQIYTDGSSSGFEYLGQTNETFVYRIDLESLGSTIQAIQLADDGIISGGTQRESGAEVDFIKVSSTLTSSPSTASSTAVGSSVAFDASNTRLEAGYQQEELNDDEKSNGPGLWGTNLTDPNLIDYASATLNVGDARETSTADLGLVAIGEEGRLTAILGPNHPRYLYIGEWGTKDDFYINLYDSTDVKARSGVSLKGTSDDDLIALGTGRNFYLGSGDDTVNGSGGNDTISTAGGNDTAIGASGNDKLDGGAGFDIARYQGLRSAYVITRDGSGNVVQVADLTSGLDGTDTLTGIESLRFKDPDTFRFFDRNDGGHFFTTSVHERNQVLATRPDLEDEGVGFLAVDDASVPGALPVYRFFDWHDGGHFFTISTAERDQVLATRPDLRFEGVGYYEFGSSQGSITDAVYRFFETHDGGHFFTSDIAERDQVLATRPDLQFEGIAFYAPNQSAELVV